MPSECFHCATPITLKHPPTLDVLGKQRAFCCAGCAAVCRAIVDSGNADYYRFRDTPARVVDAAQIEALNEKLRLYDHPEIQKDFVRGESGWKEASLILEDIECAACLWLNERHLRKLDGVLDVEMDYTSQQARVRWDPSRIQLSDILHAIQSIGYVAHPFDPTRREQLNAEQKQRSVQRLIFAAVLGMVVMNFSLSTYLFGAPDARGDYPMWVDIGRWTSLFVTALLLAYPGQLFFRDAWRQLRGGQAGMDVPVALGLSIAWLGSLHATVTQHGEVYFESIAMFVLFLLAARYAELRARLRAAAMLDRVSTIVPRLVERIDADGVAQVPVVELEPGDLIRLSPGEVVPVDGVVVEGGGSVDESLLTGESKPVGKRPGDPLVSGSINIDQASVVRVTADRQASTLERIQRLTDVGMHKQPRMVQLADRIAGVFVWGVLAIAACTALYWWLVEPSRVIGNVVAVLIVTCPCALALAAPVATTLSAAGLSRLGIVPLRMAAIEALKPVDTLVFDKTGTLTRGEPELIRIRTLGDCDQSACLSIAAAMEQGSEHPFAHAIRRRARDVDTAGLSNIRNHPGQGIEAETGVGAWRLGSAAFCGADRDALLDDAGVSEEAGSSELFLARDGEVVAVFFLDDPLREGVADALRGWRQRGIRRFVILSGDHQHSVDRVASRIDADLALGGLSPEDKLHWIESEQRHGHRLAMFGDGINDAPTLALADVSFAFSDATHLAQSSSDFIILNPGFGGLVDAFGLMFQTRRIIMQNLLWALIYNLLAIPAAAAGWVPPWLAAIGMSLSSLVVIINALRLKKSIHSARDPMIMSGYSI